MKSSKYQPLSTNPPKIIISRKNQDLSQNIKQRSRVFKALSLDYDKSNDFKEISLILKTIQRFKNLKSLTSLHLNIRFLMSPSFFLPIKHFRMIIQSLRHVKNLSVLTFVVSSHPIFATEGLYSKEKIREINRLLPNVQIKLSIIPSPNQESDEAVLKLLEFFRNFQNFGILYLTLYNRDLLQIEQSLQLIKKCKSLSNISLRFLFNNSNIEFQRFQSFLTNLKEIKPLKYLLFSFAFCGSSLNSRLNELMPIFQEISETANVEFVIQEKGIQILPKRHFKTIQNKSHKIEISHFSEPHVGKMFFLHILSTLMIIILFVFLKRYLF